jgi:hypothetical protein
VSGVLDNGGGNRLGNATVFFCTNFSNVDEKVRISLRVANPTNAGGVINRTLGFGPGETQTWGTHLSSYNTDKKLAAGTVFRQGSAIIFATSVNVHCSAAQVDASETRPLSIPLHMVRLHPANNSEEDSGVRRSTVKAADDPFEVIYRVTGVLDSGDVGLTGKATLFFCTNFGPVAERLRISLRLENPGPPHNTTLEVGPGETKTAATHGTVAYGGEDEIAPGTSFQQGSAIISATSLHVNCSAAQVDAAAAAPVGLPLHMVRLRPAPDTQE